MSQFSDATEAKSHELLQQLRDGRESAFAELFELHTPQMQQIVRFRMDRRLAGRIDVDDVLQDVFVAARKRIGNLKDSPTENFLVWMRLMIRQTLIDLCRHHLGAQRRDVSREAGSGRWSNESTSIASLLVDSMTSPSQAVSKQEMLRQVEACLNSLNEKDREIIALRHFEELGNSEVAEVLGLTQKNASIRYVRALARLKSALATVPDFDGLESSASTPEGPT